MSEIHTRLPLHAIADDDLIPLEVAAELYFPDDGVDVDAPWSLRKATNFLMLIGPGTLLRPPTAIKIAYHAALQEDEIWAAIHNGALTSYTIGDRRYVTLGDVDAMASKRGAGQLGTIYFAGFKNRVKIGFTAGRTVRRVSSLQTGCPEKLEVQASLCGTLACEDLIHDRFYRLRLHGEWFRRTPTLSAFIAQVQATDWRRNLRPDPRPPK